MYDSLPNIYYFHRLLLLYISYVTYFIQIHYGHISLHWFPSRLIVIYSVEFQKRGLPHAHIIVWSTCRDALTTADEIDKYISAKLPNLAGDPVGYRAVSQFMVHGPCGKDHPWSPCMDNGKCSKYFPKEFQSSTVVTDDGFVLYRRRRTLIVVDKNGVALDNAFVVPYNIGLLLAYDAHINVEHCHSTKLIKYLFKYICKGRDRAFVALERATLDEIHGHQQRAGGLVDEVLDDLDCRYLAAPEAIWRLFQYRMHFSSPTVERLPVHLPLGNSVLFRDSVDLTEIVNNPQFARTKLTAWFELNSVDPAARRYTYSEVTLKYTWNKSEKRWEKKKQQLVWRVCTTYTLQLVRSTI